MTPKEKALELFSSSRFILSLPGAPLGENKDHVAKQTCLLTVDEILKSEPHKTTKKYYVDIKGEYTDESYYETKPHNEFWRQVKQEIEKL